MLNGLVDSYLKLLKTDAIKYNHYQFEIIKQLQKFDEKIGFFSKYQGVYLHGAVGRGKSFVIDLYFRHSKIKKIKKVHFHQLMHKIHNQITFLENHKDPIPLIAKKIQQEAKLFFCDEFYLHDIGNAIILLRLLQALFKYKVYVIITSNYHPDELYQDGIQRENVLPAIQLIKKEMQVLEMKGESDYRALILL